MNISPTAVGMMKIRRWFSRTLEAGGMRRSNQRSRKRGSNLTPDARSRGGQLPHSAGTSRSSHCTSAPPP